MAPKKGIAKSNELFRILSLDGGGAKGFYTIGVLKEIEAMVNKPICEYFNLIFGTSTGAIIAALLALGHKVNDVHNLYKQHVPQIMRARTKNKKHEALTDLAKSVFENKKFSDFKTDIGIVATRWDFEKPIIFKSSVKQAHGQKNTFVPGFGCSIADAVVASCSAYPFFKRFVIKTGSGDIKEVIDGGYCANNPTLYSIADAVMAFKKDYADLRVISIGVGAYPEPKRWGLAWLLRRFISVQLLQKTLNINTASMEQLRTVLFKDIKTIRINETFAKPEMATDLMEHNLHKLNMLYQSGRGSYGKYENEIKQCLL